MSRPAPNPHGWLAYYRELIGAWAKGNSRHHDAEDAAQDAVVRMLGQDQAGVLDPKAYLYQASRNHLLNILRRQRRHTTVSLEDLADADHPALDADAPLRAHELTQALEKALERLPIKKRQAYIYHRLEGYTHAEIAEKLGVAINTVERYVMDATRDIRKQLQNFCPK